MTCASCCVSVNTLSLQERSELFVGAGVDVYEGMVVGENARSGRMDVNVTYRAYLGVSWLYLVTSAFTLAKTVRDAQEVTSVLSRVDEARLERFLAEHDPFRAPAA